MKSKLIKGISATLVALLSFSSLAFAACGDKEQDTTSDDTQKEEKYVIPFEYKNWTYTDGEGNQATLEYGVYVPESYDGKTPLPLVGYIPDSGWVKKSAAQIAEAECPLYWITEEKMQENPAIFVIFALTATESDTRVETNETTQIFHIIDYVCEQYAVDTDRLYWTGQSMGGIIGWGLNATRPDYFAATVYVGCQPGSKANSEDEMYVSLLEEAAFLNQKFIYISSRLDVQAHLGQDDIIAIFDENDIAYGIDFTLEKDYPEETSAKVQAVLEQGYTQNFFGFTFIDPYSTPETPTMNEHLRSFAYCYAIDPIFDWLFAQKKDSAAN